MIDACSSGSFIWVPPAYSAPGSIVCSAFPWKIAHCLLSAMIVYISFYLRWGAMVVLKSLESAPTAIVAALKDSAKHDSSEGNMMHIALLSAENGNNIRSVHVQYQVQWIFCL